MREIVKAHECLSAGMTEIFSMRPVRWYASLKVRDPRVKNDAYKVNSMHETNKLHRRGNISYLPGPSNTIKSSSCFAEPLPPYFKWIFASSDSISKFGYK